MSWAALDDRAHAHRKVRRLQRLGLPGAAAFGVWAWGLSWCRAFSPERGLLVADDVGAEWGLTREETEEVFNTLMTVGLVDATPEPGQFAIHDWADWQLGGRERQRIAASEKEARSARGREAQRIAGLERAATAERADRGRFANNPDSPASPASDQLPTSFDKLAQAGDQLIQLGPARGTVPLPAVSSPLQAIEQLPRVENTLPAADEPVEDDEGLAFQ